jgi:uncharacterized cupredoxin-like copper-binding protein
MKYKKPLIALGAILVLGVTFLSLRHYVSQPANSADSTVQQRVIHLNIINGKLADGTTTINVQQNQNLTFDITADKADELHIHGYDKEIKLEPGKLQTVTFKADKAGSFETELHGANVRVFLLDVQPE